MKLLSNPFTKKASSDSYSSYLLLSLLSFFIFFSAEAKTVVIGTGSGTVSQTSMSGLSAGDILAIKPGTYTGALFSNLNNITITNNGGTVTFTGNNYTEIGSNNTNLTITGLNYLNINSDAFLLTGTNIQGLYIYHCTFSGVVHNIVDAGGYATIYNGNISTLKVYRCAIDNCKFINCGQVWQGGYGTPSQNQALCDSVEMGYDTVTNTATDGTEVAGMISHINIHHWLITYSGINPIVGDVGVFQTSGDGQIHDCFFKGGRGYLSRQLLYGLNGVGAFYFYNNIIYGQNAYGAIDIRCDSSNYGSTNPYLKKANAWLYNCTMGNKTDINGYVCPVVIVGIMGAAGGNATCTIRNMFAFNNKYGANPIANNNANGTWAIDTANDIYSDAAHALLYLQDTTTSFMPTAASPLNSKGVAITTLFPPTPDLFKFAGTGNRVGAVYYNSGGHSVAANAGSSQIITLPLDSVTLNGSGSTVSNSTISSYNWSEISGPNTATLTSPTTVTTKAKGLIAGVYVFNLKVKDAKNDSSTSSVIITVNPVNLISGVTVSAGTNQTITLPTSTVTLTGTATDASGTIKTYLWTEVSGPNTASITTAGSATTTVTGLIAGAYVFQLKATDNNNLTGNGTVTITVNPANQGPVVNPGSNQTITLPTSTVTLTGTATDASSTIKSYLWAQVSGPNTASITNASSATTTVTGMIAGTYVFQLKATDNNNLSGTNTVTITVNPANQVPAVNAGSNQTITLPTSTVTLTGTATDASSTIKSYLWTQVSGPNTASIKTATIATTTITGLIAGTYVFQLKATDNNNLSGTGTVTITVKSGTTKVAVTITASPVSMTLPTNSTTLTATVTDPNISNPTFTTWWSEQTGPNAAKITNQPRTSTTVTGLIAGTYVFYVSITDPNGTATNTVTVTVNKAGTLAVVNDGSNLASESADTVSGVNDKNALSKESSILVFPNPTTGTINLQITNPAKGTMWAYIYDMRGNIVMAKEYNKSSIDFNTSLNLSLLSSGTYTLQAIIDKKTIMIAKFVKL